MGPPPSRIATVLSSNPHLHSIKTCINSNAYPSVSDIEMAMKPKRLAGRKEVLVDVLVKCFGMRGKCIPRKIPSNECENDGSFVLEVARKSSVNDIASFVVYKLMERQERLLDKSRSSRSVSVATKPSDAAAPSSCIAAADFSSNLFLNNIKTAIDSNKCPSVSDVEQVMKPIRLAGRKEVLIDILLHCFKMKGKCVPRKVVSTDDEFGSDNDDGGYVLEDARKCTIQEIGALVMYKLEEKSKLNEENSSAGGNDGLEISHDDDGSGAEYSNTFPPYDYADPSSYLVLDRIKTSIASNEYPSVSDVEQVMKPERLAGRKKVLIDILVKCFKMKGKCVPKTIVSLDDGIVDVDSSSILEFATKSKVNEIGEFVICKLQEKRKKKETPIIEGCAQNQVSSGTNIHILQF